MAVQQLCPPPAPLPARRPPPALLATITGVHPIHPHDLCLFLNLKIQHNLVLLVSQPEGLPALLDSTVPSPHLPAVLSENHTTISPLSQTRRLWLLCVITCL